MATFRTWLEPSKEVASFIYSTLKTLTMTEVPELRLVGEQVRGIITLVMKLYQKDIYMYIYIFFFQKQFSLNSFCFYFFRSNPSFWALNMPTMSICPSWSTTWKWSFTKKSLGLPALKILSPQDFPSAPCFSVIFRDVHNTISRIHNFTNFQKKANFLVKTYETSGSKIFTKIWLAKEKSIIIIFLLR